MYAELASGMRDEFYDFTRVCMCVCVCFVGVEVEVVEDEF